MLNLFGLLLEDAPLLHQLILASPHYLLFPAVARTDPTTVIGALEYLRPNGFYLVVYALQLLLGSLVEVSLSLVAALDLQTQFFLKDQRHLNIVQPLLFLIQQLHPPFYFLPLVL